MHIELYIYIYVYDNNIKEPQIGVNGGVSG